MKAFKIQHLLFLILGLSVASCNTTATNNEEKGPVQVRVQPTAMKAVEQTLDFTGVVQPFEEAHIAPAVPGRIDRILVDVGDKVSKGQLLVNMDRTQLFQAQVQLENLEKELARMDTLLKAGAVTQQSYDQLKTQVDVAQSNIRNLATHTEIRSPLDGVITGRYFSEGEMFSMTPGPAGKPAIVSVNQIRPVKVTIGVSERFLPQVKIGQAAQVITDVFPGQEFEGQVNKIYPTIDRASGTFKVEVVTANQEELLSPGIFARVALDLNEQQALLVPALAVLKQTGSNERYVFVIEDNKAVRRTVLIGKNFNEYQEIISGLQPGQTLVVTGQHNLIHGAEVEVVE